MPALDRGPKDPVGSCCADRHRGEGSLHSTGSEAAAKGELQSIVDRITIALIPKVARELGRLQDRTKLTKTDLVNRAITLYEFLEAQQAEGKDVLLRNKASGEVQIIQFL